MEKEVSLRDANQRFSQYVREVEAGGELVITRRGRPVAKLVPFRTGSRVLTREQRAALERSLKTLKAGGWRSSPGWKFNRDEAHER
jgi:prevent-host-death family protein